MDIIFNPIGYIESPFKSLQEIPRQSIYSQDRTARIKLLTEYVEGLEGMAVNSHIMVLFHFHQSKGYDLRIRSHDTGEMRGVFSTRSPHRPNGIGISVVKVTNIYDNVIEFCGVDMLDGTPVLDIKPYSSQLNPDIIQS